MTNRAVVQYPTPGISVGESRPLFSPHPFARRRKLLLEIGLPLLVYALVAIPAAYRRAQLINPDAVCYIRRAVYLVGSQYHWSDVVSGYWSPLISWCIAPLLKLGVDGLIAAKLVLLFWGGVWVLTTGAFLRRICPTTPNIRIGAGCVLAIAGAVEAVNYVTPDIILSACLFGYLTLAASPRLLVSRRLAFGAGLVGGFAYLVKSYGLPFFFAHATFAVLYRLVQRRISPSPGTPGEGRGGGSGISDFGFQISDSPHPNPPPEYRRRGRPWCRAVLTAIAMFAGFFLLAGPWIAILSLKYHKPTFSTVGPAAHAVIAPPWIPRVPKGGELPPDPYLTMNEIPELSPYPYWSPFSSKANFMYQLAIVRDHARDVLIVFLHLDLLRLGLLAMIAAALLAVFRPFGRRFRDKRRVLWLLTTAAIYISGFLFVYFEPRYVNSVLPPLGLMLCLALYSRLRPSAVQRPPKPVKRGLRWLRDPMIVPTIIAISFGYIFAQEALKVIRDQPIPLRPLARAVRAAGIHGPITTGPANRTQGIYVAYLADVKAVAFPSLPRHAPPGMPPALAAAHVDGILCFVSAQKDAPVVDDAARDAAMAAGWTLASRVGLDRRHAVEIWVPPARPIIPSPAR